MIPTDPGKRPSEADRSTDRLNDFLRQVVATVRDEFRSDTELLARFADRGDQDAFRALVGRHGRSVWASCLAVLNDSNDAEDAFQAAFLALARRAHAVDATNGVGAWLRATARRAARKLHRSANRLNRLRDKLAADSQPEERADGESHAWALAAEELDRLPRRLREALVLYHLEGRTLAQAAEALGCSVTEAHRRVSCGIEKLRTRLSARGVTLTASVLAAIPASLVTNTANAACALARGLAPPSPRVAALTEEILAPRLPGWLVAAGATLLLAAGTAVALVSVPTPPPAQVNADARPKPPAEVQPAEPAGRTTAPLRGRVTDATGRPVSGASVAALVRRPWAPGNRGLRDDVVAGGITDADGRYAIAVPADFTTHYPERSVTLLISGTGLPSTTRLVGLESGGADVGVPAPRTVRGMLIGPDGMPATGVRLGVVRLGSATAEPVQGQERKLPPGWPADVISDDDGTFRIIGLPAGEDVWVEVRDDRFALSTVRLAANQPHPVSLVLAPPRVVEGRVTAADTGKPLAGASVSVFVGPWKTHSGRYTAVTSTARSASDAPAVEFDTRSGPDGTFRLRLPPTGPYHVSVHPPVGSAYLGLRRELVWADDRPLRELSFELPVGRVVRGVVKDDAGWPIADGWVMYQPGCGNRQLPEGALVGRDAPARTAPDGSFAMAVPPGPGSLEGWGPTPNYRPASQDSQPCPWCARHSRRSFEHALARFNADLAIGRGPVALTLQRGLTVRIGVTDSEGKPASSGVAVCRPVVRPLRNLVTQPLPIRDGGLDLPGCAPGRVYPIALLDPEGERGAVAEVRVGDDKPQVRLERCGSAEVRLVDLSRRPVADVPAAAVLLLNCDRVATEPGSNTGEWVVDQSWFDPKHHLPRPVTNADGRVTFRALVPGAEYAVYFFVREKVYTSSVFRVAPGRVTQLPDVIVLLGRLSSQVSMEETLP